MFTTKLNVLHCYTSIGINIGTRTTINIFIFICTRSTSTNTSISIRTTTNTSTSTSISNFVTFSITKLIYTFFWSQKVHIIICFFQLYLSLILFYSSVIEILRSLNIILLIDFLEKLKQCLSK